MVLNKVISLFAVALVLLASPVLAKPNIPLEGWWTGHSNYADNSFTQKATVSFELKRSTFNDNVFDVSFEDGLASFHADWTITWNEATGKWKSVQYKDNIEITKDLLRFTGRYSTLQLKLDPERPENAAFYYASHIGDSSQQVILGRVRRMR